MRRLPLRRLVCRGAGLLGVLAAVIWVGLGLVSPPLLVNRSGFSQAFYDRDGSLLRLSLASDEKYRLWVPLERIPESMQQATLLQEDRAFFYHPGINPWALLRGALSTYVTGARRIGGSTITMQLARQRFNIHSRSLAGKFRQLYYALLLERHYSKDRILEAYLNLVPYGGNVEGVAAASLIYFKKDVSRLSLPESLLLAVVPQSPHRREPSRFASQGGLEAARKRLYQRWQEHFSADGNRELIEGANLMAASKRELPFAAPHLVDAVRRATPYASSVTTTLSLPKQTLLESQLARFVERNRRLGVNNATAVLIDYATMEVRAYVGSAAYFNVAIQGQVDGLDAKRSPGSALKPFIYGLALDRGLIHPHTMLKDTALRISSYNPENFERDFLGPVGATDALVRSRNVPAILLANQLGDRGLYSLLRAADIRGLKEEDYYGLAVALGGLEITMRELGALYAMLANGGVYRPVKLMPTIGDESTPKRLLSPEASYAVLEMLRENPRPSWEMAASSMARIPWKTGTSYGFRDAWAMGIVGPYVLGVWVGNFDGAANSNFIGRDMAGPLFFGIADALHAEGPLLESVVHQQLNLRKVRVCSLSGALPGPHCHSLKESWFIPGVSPIASCGVHREVSVDKHTGLRLCAGFDQDAKREVYEFWPSDVVNLFRLAGVGRRTPPPFSPMCKAPSRPGAAPLISSPQPSLIYSVRWNESSEISFAAVTDADSREVFWFVDDSLVGSSPSGQPFFWKARPGNFVVRAVDDQGRANSRRIQVSMVSG